jgi:hypothetical protein
LAFRKTRSWFVELVTIAGREEVEDVGDVLGSAGSLYGHCTMLLYVHWAMCGLFADKRDEVAGECRKLHNEELHQMLLERSDEGG